MRSLGGLCGMSLEKLGKKMLCIFMRGYPILYAFLDWVARPEPDWFRYAQIDSGRFRVIRVRTDMAQIGGD